MAVEINTLPVMIDKIAVALIYIMKSFYLVLLFIIDNRGRRRGVPERHPLSPFFLL